VPPDPCFDALLADRRVQLRPPAPPVTLGDLRAGANAFMRVATGPALPSVEPVSFLGASGRHITGRAYRATTAEPRPAILFLHGGGFVFGDLDTHDATCRTLAASSGCTVLAVNYRLAPEHPFPAAVDDATDALLHVARVPAAFRVRGGALAIAADSAGAHVAIGAVLATVGAHGAGIGAACGGGADGAHRGVAAPLALAHVALLYPVIDPRCASPSMHELARGYMLTRDAMLWFWECYAPDATRRADPLVDLATANLARFPPATIVTAEYDPLRDEGEAFAARLDAAGVAVQLERCAGMIHGFAGMPQLTPVATQVLERLGRTLAAALGVAPGPGSA
jgi:acetyl esterase